MSTPLEPTGGIDTVENAIELKDVEGLSQGQIVRRRFFRHRGALGGLFTLVLVAILAYTSIGAFGIPGWWQWDYYTPGKVAERRQPDAEPADLAGWRAGSPSATTPSARTRSVATSSPAR